MIPDDVTQPYQPSATPRSWPPARPTRPPRQSRQGRGLVWGIVGFIAGCILTALVAMAAFVPAPAPSAATQSSAAVLKVTLTDSLLTTAMASGQQPSAVSLTQPRAHIQPNGEIVITGVLEGTPVAAGSAVTVVTQPYVSQRTLAIKVLRASVGGFALPPATLNLLRDQINQQLAKSSHVSLGVGQGLDVSGIVFDNGAMTISYSPAGA